MNAKFLSTVRDIYATRYNSEKKILTYKDVFKYENLKIRWQIQWMKRQRMINGCHQQNSFL